MKYNQFFAELTAAGCYVLRHGANHDYLVQSQDGKQVCFVKARQTGSTDRNGT